MAMKNFLNSVKIMKPKGNTFDMSHDVKLSCNPGWLVPTCVIDCVPGDKWNIGCESLTRFAPMVAPVMHRADVYMHYWFVPKRIIWPNWKNYRTNTEVGGSIPAFPQIALDNTNTLPGTLADYLGLPNIPSGTLTVNAMPFAAYQAIYNEYYRDQNLISAVDYELVDGDNSSNTDLRDLRRRAWEHDYFTAALPFAQKGDAVEIPISGEVTLDTGNLGPANRQLVMDGTGTIIPAANLESENLTGGLIANDGSTNPAWIDPNGSLQVTNADTSINDLRRAYALQRFLEKLARGGSRLAEFIRTQFGVRSSDARLQRPEYITGTKSPIVIGEVLNTTGTVDAPQGNMSGHGVGVTSGKYGQFFCEEDGYIIGIMSIMPKTAYQQGVPKHFLKGSDPYEFYLPDFAHIGEQEVRNVEVYVAHTDPDGTFGYMPRYGEYKYENNRVAGEFKTSLNFWHWGRIFTSDPALSQEFIECDPSHRIFAVTDPDEHKCFCHVYHKITARRLMPKFGTPTF